VTAVLVAAFRVMADALHRQARLPLVREVLRHWAANGRTLRQGLIALTLSGGVGLAAGLVLGSMEGLLAELPGLLVLVPAAIGMRGAIFGALGARLGTGMLLGQFELTMRRRSFVGQNVEAAIVLTLASSAAAALLARAMAGLFGLPSISLLELVTISMLGGLLASAFVLIGVLVLARTAFNRSWDMDAIGSPLITATGDVVTLPALVVAALALRIPHVAVVLGTVFLVLAVLALVHGVLRAPDAARTVVTQSLGVLLYASTVDILAGTVLEARVEDFISSPALLVLIPPFIANCGSVGGILSARLGSDLHLGLISPRVVPERLAGLELSFTILFSGLAFVSVGLIGHVGAVATGLTSPGLSTMVGVSVLGGALASVLLVIVSWSTASATYRLGRDPDNYGIPIVTATMDLLGVLCLVAAISIIGVS
jgi:mgtE-like transporter